MDNQQHFPLLKRVGTVLMVVGLVDLGVMIYCILNQISYSSSFNIFAIVAGAFLRRGSLRTASIVTFFVAMFLSAGALLIVASLLIQPTGLTLTRFRLHSPSFIFSIISNALFVIVLLWVLKTLTEGAVTNARLSKGGRPLSLRIPVLCGMIPAVLMAWLATSMTGGEAGIRAKELAAQQLGGGYEYYVTSLERRLSGNDSSIKATVTAWNGKDIREVPVQWQQ